MNKPQSEKFLNIPNSMITGLNNNEQMHQNLDNSISVSNSPNNRSLEEDNELNLSCSNEIHHRISKSSEEEEKGGELVIDKDQILQELKDEEEKMEGNNDENWNIGPHIGDQNPTLGVNSLQ